MLVHSVVRWDWTGFAFNHDYEQKACEAMYT